MNTNTIDYSLMFDKSRQPTRVFDNTASPQTKIPINPDYWFDNHFNYNGDFPKPEFVYVPFDPNAPGPKTGSATMELPKPLPKLADAIGYRMR